MASPLPVLLLLPLAALALYCSSVCGEEFEGQGVTQGFQCFDNNLIYNGCESAYRLNPSGNLNVPLQATNLFCNGPCLIETQLLLNCLDHAFDNFLFYNKATVLAVQNALRAGCSYSTQRGNFNPGYFMQGEISKGHTLQKWVTLYYVLFLIGCCFIL
ncbi:uncharacterized protein LOC111486529 [Cucurbita maxima]|uniref:Uncharacterized protein LOC111486529 n=1 Tax=Cucurbita maxima TaxID=3661 RepID=A0A6J1JMH7_CUCMA|nr:uncharacterized protein LOC111486529 [Cucurbita maxima]